MTFSEAAHALLRGEIASAAALADRVLSLHGTGYSNSYLLSIYGGLQVAIHEAADTTAALLPLVDQALVLAPGYVTWHAVAAAAALAAGDRARARRELNVVSRNEFGDLVRDSTWTAAMTFVAPAVAAVGTRAEIETLYRLLEPHEGRFSWNGLTAQRPIDHAMALLADALDRPEAAARHRHVAAAMVAAVSD